MCFFRFSISGLYYAPEHGPISSYLDYIKSLPLNQNPEVFWLHGNANLTAAINESLTILRNAMSMINAFGGGGGDEEEEGTKPDQAPQPSDHVLTLLTADISSLKAGERNRQFRLRLGAKTVFVGQLQWQIVSNYCFIHFVESRWYLKPILPPAVKRVKKI